MKSRASKKSSVRKKPAKKIAPRSKKRPARRAGVGKAKTLLSAAQIRLLRGSFALIEPQANIAAMIFYRNLFALDPSLRPLFHTSIELQGRKLMEALGYTLATLEKPDDLVPVLESLGRRHVLYGTKDEHYATVNQALLQTLGDCLNEKFTPEVKAAWEKALAFVATTMRHGAKDVQALLAEGAGAGTKGKCPFGH